MVTRQSHGIMLAVRSALKFVDLIIAKRLHVNSLRNGEAYQIRSGSYAIFRETICDNVGGEANILVIGFRLRLIRSSRILHWIFRKVCIVTTPFWCGLDGFRIKLWMVSPRTKNYLGIYDWRGKEEAEAYVHYLLPILRLFSVKNSVWCEHILCRDLEDYLHKHTAAVSIQTAHSSV